MSETPGPGIYEGVPDAEYRAWPYPSKSLLAMFRDRQLCDAEIKWKIEHPTEATTEMMLGHHVEGVVQGHDPFGNVQRLPDEIKQRRGKAWDSLRAAHPNADFLPPSEWAKHADYIRQVHAMAKSLTDDEDAGKIIRSAKHQVAFVWDCEYTGMAGQPVVCRVKGLLDEWVESAAVIGDIKTTSRGGPRAVGAQAYDHGWDLQSALYTDAMNALTGKDHRFYFLVVRSVEPYVCTVYNGHHTDEAAKQYLQYGRLCYQRYLERLRECRANNQWNGYRTPDAPEKPILNMNLPAWAE